MEEWIVSSEKFASVSRIVRLHPESARGVLPIFYWIGGTGWQRKQTPWCAINAASTHVFHFLANDTTSITIAATKITMVVKIFQLCSESKIKLRIIHSDSRTPWRRAWRTVAL